MQCFCIRGSVRVELSHVDLHEPRGLLPGEVASTIESGGETGDDH
jgi:hypothetical protein